MSTRAYAEEVVRAVTAGSANSARRDCYRADARREAVAAKPDKSASRPSTKSLPLGSVRDERRCPTNRDLLSYCLVSAIVH